MHTFIWKGKDPDGLVRSVRVPGDNAQEAKEILLKSGWTDLQLIMDEIADVARQDMRRGEEQHPEVVTTPDQVVNYFEGQKNPGFWSQYLSSLGEAKFTVLLSVLLLVFGIYSGRRVPLYLGIACVVALVLLFPVLHVFFSMPSRYYQRLNRAKVWSQWDEVLRCVHRLRQIRRLVWFGPGELELTRCECQALAATGHLPEAVEKFATFERSPTVPHWSYLSFLASIYDSAKDYEQSLVCREQAAAAKPDTVAVWIDLAFTNVRGLNRPDKAREALARAQAMELPTLAKPYLPFISGLICWREGNNAEAKTHLETALEGFKAFAHLPLMQGVLLLAKGYLCVVCGRLGERALAAKLFKEAAPFLRAGREQELLEQCQAALAQA